MTSRRRFHHLQIIEIDRRGTYLILNTMVTELFHENKLTNRKLKISKEYVIVERLKNMQ